MAKFTPSKNTRIGDALSGIEFFAATVSAGSFARAATRLGLTASAVSRRVAKLEEDMGVQLLARTTRTLRPTDDGAAFYERCTRILQEVEEARGAFAHAKAKPSGLLRVDAPLALGRVKIAPSIPRLLERYRELRVDLTLRDALVDPVAEGLDVLVRVGELVDSSLVARRLGTTRMLYCASPEYLRRRGTPRTPDDLVRHDAIGYLRDGRPSPFFFDEGHGLHAVEVRGRFNANDAEALLRLALAGHGIGSFFDFIVEDALRTGALVQVLPRVTTLTRPIHALYTPNRHLLPKVHAFVEHAAGLFARA